MDQLVYSVNLDRRVSSENEYYIKVLYNFVHVHQIITYNINSLKIPY